MSTPNPANVFGRRMPPRTPESLPSPTLTDEEPVIPAVLEKTTDESAKALVINHTLGNHELPIADFREKIVDAVHASQATIITAETGAGKSTQVPQFLAEAGDEVVVTQPRIVAARSVSERVRDEIVARKGEEYADFVGYRTSRERNDSVNTQILFATDGLQLVRELSGNGVGKKQVLVLDEVHEWNENMEVLVAWAKQRMNEDPNFKVVVMSATMEAGPLAEYFGDQPTVEDDRSSMCPSTIHHTVPIIEVPGRTYEVKMEEGGDVADQAIKMAKEGKNTLVFVPGKAEIDKVIAAVERANIPGATVLPLHGSLEPAEQRKVFAKYPGVKVIVATNVAQTSITIEDIDAVIDSGLERRNEVRNGVEGLFLHPISKADCLQRAGRAGRTKAGEYVLAQLDNNPFVPFADREEYGTPEILRTRLDGMVLRLAKNGFDAAAMDFFHSKDKHGRDIKPEIATAKERLRNLGALREDGSVTQIGRDMERMPVESHYARMMIEARKYGPEVQMQLAALLAVQEADGITQFSTKNKPCQERWRALLDNNFNDSDMIKQLEVFVAAQRMSDREKRDNDLFMKAFSKAAGVLHQLRGVEKLQGQDLSMPSTEQREQLLRCIVSGMVDNLYISDHYGGHMNAKGDAREVSQRSTIRPGKMVVGTPFDLQITTRRGLATLNLLEGPTNVPSVDVLREVAPQLFNEVNRGYRLQSDGAIVEEWTQEFNGQNVGNTELRPSKPSSERKAYLVDILASQEIAHGTCKQLNDEVYRLSQKTGRSLRTLNVDDVKGMLEVCLPIETNSVDVARGFLPELAVGDIIGLDEYNDILVHYPDSWRGYNMYYRDGQPYVKIRQDEIEHYPDDSQLEDGREILVLVDSNRFASIVELKRDALAEKMQKLEKATYDLAVGFAQGVTSRWEIDLLLDPSCKEMFEAFVRQHRRVIEPEVVDDPLTDEEDELPQDDSLPEDPSFSSTGLASAKQLSDLVRRFNG